PARVLPFPLRRWVTGVAVAVAAAAIIVLAIRVRPAWLGFGPRTGRPELRELIAALANEPTRPVEGRLTGGFEYAPPPSPTRGPGDRALSPEVQIAVAAMERASLERPSAGGSRTLGVAYLIDGNLDDAIRALERACADQP